MEEESRDWRESSRWTDEERPGVNIRGARHREGLTQKQLAALTGLPLRRLSALENNKAQATPEEAARIAAATNAHVFLFRPRPKLPS